jgi:biopolymer transport protein ExbB
LQWRHRLEHWLGSIALTASVSPLLGLVGTVSGMITTFKLMTVFGTSDANTVSAGISEAMITTKLGLVVAVPSLVAHALMTRQVKNYFTQLENLGVELSQLPLGGANSGVRHEP